MSDADLANSLDTRKFHTGFAFLLNHAAIYWKSSQQNLIAPSSTESHTHADLDLETIETR